MSSKLEGRSREARDRHIIRTASFELRAIQVCVLLAMCCLLPPSLQAQSTTGMISMTEEAIAALGGAVTTTQTALLSHAGEPAGGEMSNGAMTLVAGYPTQRPVWPGGIRTMTVTGTVDEPVSSVSVNDMPATISGLSFAAEITLVEGLNLITAETVDLAGNRAATSITVTLDTQPPPKPTVGASLIVTTANDDTLSGTKISGTSIWISAEGGNEVEVVPLNEATTWSATITQVVEGDNLLSVVAKDALGNVSATVTVNVIVDDLPPVITLTSPTKTNLTPVLVTGTVDDSLTVVEVDGVMAARSGRTFECVVPFTEGAHPVTITATSPNNHAATTTATITLGTMPTITAVHPSDGALLYADDVIPLTIEATDKEGDALSYHLLLDGMTLSEWTGSASFSWMPILAQRGNHLLEVQVRDGFGGYTSQHVGVYVVRQPVPPPSA